MADRHHTDIYPRIDPSYPIGICIDKKSGLRDIELPTVVILRGWGLFCFPLSIVVYHLHFLVVIITFVNQKRKRRLFHFGTQIIRALETGGHKPLGQPFCEANTPSSSLTPARVLPCGRPHVMSTAPPGRRTHPLRILRPGDCGPPFPVPPLPHFPLSLP